MNTPVPLLVLLLVSGLLAAVTARAGADEAPKEEPRNGFMGVIAQAIQRGVPLYNAGDHQACADIYEAAARRLLSMGDALPALDLMDLEAALAAASRKPGDKAWNLRHAFDRITTNADFEPRIEASLPKGFPAAGPVGRVVEKSYPGYRAARADGRGAFWMLFRHIKKNDVQMTAPVEMRMDDAMRQVNMAFLYEAPDQGEAGPQGRVKVLDLEPVTVLSVGVRGARSQERVEQARKAIEAKLEADGYQRAGDWRMMGYNSPMVPAEKRFWELQIPVTR